MLNEETLDDIDVLKEHDLAARINFCSWFLWSIHDGELHPQLMFFSDEAWFSLCGEVNSQNNSTDVQKIQDSFTNFLFMMKKLVFGVR
jgi:hypothetical protein